MVRDVRKIWRISAGSKKPRSPLHRLLHLTWLAIEILLHPRPILFAPGLFGLGDQVFGDTAMRQHELRTAIRRRCQRYRGHRKDAFGESTVAPCLNDAPAGDEIDVDPGDIVPAD